MVHVMNVIVESKIQIEQTLNLLKTIDLRTLPRDDGYATSREAIKEARANLQEASAWLATV